MEWLAGMALTTRLFVITFACFVRNGGGRVWVWGVGFWCAGWFALKLTSHVRRNAGDGFYARLKEVADDAVLAVEVVRVVLFVGGGLGVVFFGRAWWLASKLTPTCT